MGHVNIPTDLLRTLVAVVDQNGFTRAAAALGVTQPAVSAQVKRLQAILGQDLFDKGARGIKLTETGEIVVSHARRMLSMNDQMLRVLEPDSHARTIRVGVPADFVGVHFASVLADFRRRRPDLRFSLYQDSLERQLSELRKGQLDIAVGLSTSAPHSDVRHRWTEQMVWMRGRSTRLDPAKPVPLVSLRDDCVYYRAAVMALNRSGRSNELVLTVPSLIGLAAAVNAGLGIVAMVRCRVAASNLLVWDDAPLPKLPDLHWGFYLREGGDRELLEQLADAMADPTRFMTVESAKRSVRPTGKAVVGIR